MLFLWALHPCYKAIINLFASKQKDILVTTINSIISNAKYIGDLAFFGTNGKPCLVTDDPLDDAYPPEVSQVDPFDEYPRDHYGSPVEGIAATLHSPLNAHLLDGTEDNSVSVGIG